MQQATTPLRLPAPVGRLLSLLPSYPGSMLFATGLNLALAARLPSDVKEALSSKRVRVTVRDAGMHFDFVCRNGMFSALPGKDVCELEIAASAHDFLLLARRKVDPDTLFFARRLSIEGDTELGLMVKNALDAVEF